MARRKKLGGTEDDDKSASASAPSARVYNDWTPKKITAAQRSAEQGDLTLAVMVCDWLFTDDRIADGLDKRCERLFGLPVTFEPSGDKRRSNRAVKALEAGEDGGRPIPRRSSRSFTNGLCCSASRRRGTAGRSFRPTVDGFCRCLGIGTRSH